MAIFDKCMLKSSNGQRGQAMKLIEQLVTFTRSKIPFFNLEDVATERTIIYGNEF